MDGSLAKSINSIWKMTKWQVKVEENKKILYIAFKLAIPTYGVDSIIANVSSITDIYFKYVRLAAKQVLKI